jgi:carbon-monoxide dehydrogenase large subunit
MGTERPDEGTCAIGRQEDERLLRGGGRYTDDLAFNDALHGVVVRASHAAARITGVDTAAASAMPGVVGIVTGGGLAAEGVGDLPYTSTIKAPDGAKVPAHAMPVLARNAVRYVGEPVAFVVAETLAAARDGAEAVAVEYAAVPHVTDLADAAAPGAPRVHDGLSSNVVGELVLGDAEAVESVFAGAAHRIALRVRNNRVLPHPMEPRAAIGLYDPASERWTLHCGTQAAHQSRSILAKSVFGVPAERIRIVVGDMGGGFGGRITPYPEDVLVLHAARRFGRPVRWRADRTEGFLTDTHARDHLADVEIALDADLRIAALRVVDLANLGAYPTFFAIPISTTTGNRIATGAYRIAHAHVSVRTVLTNTAPTGPYRGAGRPEAIHRLERILDVAARRLGVDPVELRRRNLLGLDDLPYRVVSGLAYDSGDFPAMLERAQALADWDGFEARRAASAGRGLLRGYGLAYHIDSTSGLSPREQASIALDAGGRVRVLSGTQEMGQGLRSTYADIVSRRLGLPRGRIEIVQGDTDVVPQGPGSYGSRSLYTGGAAVTVAAERLAEALTTLAAERFEAAAADLRLADGEIAVAGTDRHVALATLAAEQPGGTVAADGEAEAPFNFPNGCYVCEVEVDPRTGTVAVVRFCGVDDAGRVLNPQVVEGQTHGGLAQGIGQALFEAIVYDSESGQLLTGSPLDYALPRATDLPAFETVLDESQPADTNLLGTKGAGESGAVGAPPAVAAAVIDALRAYGVEHLDMPITPEAVWRIVARGQTKGR